MLRTAKRLILSYSYILQLMLSCKFDVHVTVHRDKFLITKQSRCTNFSNLFLGMKIYMFGQFLCPSSGVFHCTHSNGICHTSLLTACEQEHMPPAGNIVGGCIIPQAVTHSLEHPDPACKLSENLYDIYHCCVYGEKLLTMDRGTVRNK
jgi:hypothetical protein